MTKKEREKLAKHMAPIIQETLKGNIASSLQQFQERLNDHLIENLPPEFEMVERYNDSNVKKIVLLHRGFVFKNVEFDLNYSVQQKLELAMIAHKTYERMADADDVDHDEYRKYIERLTRF